MSIFIDIEKNLGNFQLKVKLEAGDEVLALLGASGCGKSMTLKCIAGIERPDRGKIVVDGVTLFDSERHINLTPQERHTGLMFQNYALFPNMTVRQNIYAGTRRERKKRHGRSSGIEEQTEAMKKGCAGSRLSKSLANANVEEIMQRFGLDKLADHLPSQLSGGQQQRTALARLLVSSPQILMLDEPFSALDTFLRLKMEQEVGAEIRRFGKTVILVSHDRDEVFRMADKIAIIHDGKVESFGTREEVFRNPCTRNGAILTGCRNISVIEKLGERELFARDWGIVIKTKEDIADRRFVGLKNIIEYRFAENGMDSAPNDDVLKRMGENSSSTSGIHEEKMNGCTAADIACDIVNVTENPSSYMISLWPATGADSLSKVSDTNGKIVYSRGAKPANEGIVIEVPKTEGCAIPRGRVVINIPEDAVMLLND